MIRKPFTRVRLKLTFLLLILAGLAHYVHRAVLPGIATRAAICIELTDVSMYDDVIIARIVFRLDRKAAGWLSAWCDENIWFDDRVALGINGLQSSVAPARYNAQNYLIDVDLRTTILGSGVMRGRSLCIPYKCGVYLDEGFNKENLASWKPDSEMIRVKLAGYFSYSSNPEVDFFHNELESHWANRWLVFLESNRLPTFGLQRRFKIKTIPYVLEGTVTRREGRYLAKERKSE